ncbi:hypothetical protein [Colwellia ponticola]|uniref:Uncharacterized protein n=1 Tax=Colwellia ponticola TaxID=2304625 RepID=A0A8H2JL34_9GAMM|nr:hypothetical protein [Colwellia ponticola]TMM44025.1 hypothetical protein FCS21_11505 [Colwellia ponticola]
MKQSNDVQTTDEHTKVEQPIDRRKSTDFWHYTKTILALSSWLLFLIALVMSYYAAPDKDYGVLRYYGVEIRQFWLTPLTGYLYILLWLSAMGSYIALMTEKYRCRRLSDNPNYSLLFLLTINIAWLVYLLVQAQ